MKMMRMSTRYSVGMPASTFTRFPTTSTPVMFRSVSAARATPSSTASRNPSGEDAMTSVTRATATALATKGAMKPQASSPLEHPPRRPAAQEPLEHVARELRCRAGAQRADPPPDLDRKRELLAVPA
jgi:hypothetical protein